jgi:hypothetical protein
VHYRQIQDAAMPVGHDQQQDQYLPLVLRTFIWGFPRQYQAPAPPGTTIALEIPGWEIMSCDDAVVCGLVSRLSIVVGHLVQVGRFLGRPGCRRVAADRADDVAGKPVMLEGRTMPP